MEGDYISREAALEITTRTCGDYAAAFAEISRLPAVDAVQVTRCRDCDGRRVEISWCGTYVRCGFRDATGLNMPEDGFCSLGRQKNDENERTAV